MRTVVRFLDDTLLSSPASRRERPKPNAVVASGIDIPRAYALRGARMAYEIEDDAMIGAGITNGDILFVKPTRSEVDAIGRIVVCRLGDAEYVRTYDVRPGRVRLVSRNERYPPIEINEETTQFEMIGIVVGRTGRI